MFNRFIKKSSKFFAVLLTATLAFTPLSYAATPTTFTEFQTFISDGTATTIELDADIIANEIEQSAVTQSTTTLTITSADTTNKTIDATSGNKNSGFEMGEGQTTTINNLTFKNFYKEGEGAVVNNDKGTLIIENSKFENNKTDGGFGTGFGGAIGHNRGSLTIKNSTFTANSSDAAGAVFSTGPITVNDSLFEDNTATYAAGAMGFFGHGDEITSLTDVTFNNNSSAVGGAISLGSEVDLRITNNSFTGNKATGNEGNGGAISSQNVVGGTSDFSTGYLSIIGSVFKENSASQNGGAIDNYYYKSKNDNSSDAVYINDTKFESNQAVKGGAIYNHSAADGDGTAASMLIENSTFTANSASSIGGGIYNAGKMTIKDSSFSQNTSVSDGGAIYADGEVEIKTSTFDSNVSSTDCGGAIFVRGTTDIQDSTFENNKAAFAGAIYSGLISDLTLKNSKFTNNEAQSIGAVGLYKNAVLTNNIFENNKSTSSIEFASGAGALFAGSVSTVVVDSNTFTGNISEAGGGAINTRRTNNSDGSFNNNSGAKLDITDSTFTGNQAARDGGAISNYFYNSNTKEGYVYVGDSTFEGNSAANGGAIYNHGEQDSAGNSGAMVIENSTFTGNTATENGGAIFNASTMTINNSEFSGNKANGAANDIYNTGELSFLSGTTTMEGGIAGNGRMIIDGGTLVLGEEAVLEQSYLEIAENSSLAVNASSITLISNQNEAPTINNNGSLILSTGTVESFSSKIAGTGTTTINLGANINMGYNSIEQSGLTVDEDSSLTAAIQNLKIQSTDNSGETPTVTPGTITNNGTITLLLDSNRDFDLNIVSDEGKDGTLVFEMSDSSSGEAAATSRQDIKQSTITIGDNVTYINLNSNTIETNYISGSKLQNDGKLILNLSEDAGYGLSELKGVGVSSITVESGNVTINNTGTMEQTTIETYGAGSLLLTGNKIIANVVNYMTGNCLDLATRIEGTLDNNPANEETEGVVNILDGGSISGQITNSTGTINITSTGFEVETGITSNNTSDITKNKLNIGSGTVAGVVTSSKTIEYQTITVSSGSLTMNSGDIDGTIANSSIKVEANGLLSVNPEKLVDMTSPITNDGIVEYYGGGEDLDYVLNTTTITATDKGTLRINGNVQNDEAIGISKQDIQVLQTSTFTVNTNDMTDSKIENAGDLTFLGFEPMTNETEVTGLTDAESGETVYGNLNIDTELVNNAKIEQTDIITGTYLTNNSEITAHGIIYNYLEIDNKSTINAATLRNEANTGSIINESGATITATTKLFNMGSIDNTGNIAAQNEAGDALLENAEDATIKNNADASISADLVTNKGAILSSGTITATEITNEEGSEITNYDDGIITAGEIKNAGTLTSNANGIQSLVSNDATGVYNITGGTIAYTISGAASGGSVVNISNEVTLSSQVYISQNAINLTEESTFILENEQMLETSTLNIGNKSTLDTQNGQTAELIVDGINIEQGITWNWKLDLDLADNSGDMLTNVTSNGILLIDDIKLLSDKGTVDPIQIADANVSAQIVDGAIFATQNNEYEITADNREDSTWLSVMVKGTGGLPRAIYDGASSYSIVSDGEVVTDMVTKWMEEPEGTPNNFLKNDLTIHGNNNILTSTTNVTGIDVNNHELTIEDLQEFSGFDNALSVDEGGELKVKNVTFTGNTGDAVIASSGTVSLSGVTFAEADESVENEASIDVLNNGDLVLTGEATTFNKGIKGDEGKGTTTIKGIGIDMGDAVLVQNRIEISDVEGSSLTVKVANLSTGTVTTSLIMNNGELYLSGSGEDDETVADLQTEIKGFGNTTLYDEININANVLQSTVTLSGATATVGNNAIIKTLEDLILTDSSLTVSEGSSISATTISVDATSDLTVSADAISTASNSGITNNGEITFTGGTNKNVIEGETGILFISGEVANSTGTKVSQQFIEVKEDAKFVMNADDIETATDGDIKGIQNNGDLEITGGTNKNIIGRGDAAVPGNGNVIISGNVINEEETTIDQGSITVNDGASLQANASDLTTDNGIANAGDLVFVGSNMVNTSTITGTGNLTIDGDLENDQNITQTNIDILSGTVEHNVGEGDEMATITASNITISSGATLITHSQVVASEQITNDGTLKINVLKPAEDGGGADEISSSNNIIGKGDLVISSTVYTNDGGTISQKTLKIEDSDSGFETDIANLTISDGITNEGLMTYTGEGVNKIEITGEGSLTIAGTIVNSTGTAISQNAIAITNGNGFKTIADDITTTEGIENNGTLTFIGGTNNNEITMAEDGEGILVVENDLVNQANIEQKEINITGGDFENVRTSSITAETITVAAGSTLITDALDLDISDSITLSGEGTVLNLTDEEAAEIAASITGAGKIVKEGEGTVTLSGENGYTGTTTISKGAIEIEAANGISTNTIYMDGGKLIINGADEVSLANEIMGTDHNDVNIEVVGSTTTLTGTIYGNKDLVKTGEGVLDLQMETNGYAGNTIISSGTVIGTTKNINGKVSGSGDEYSVVEFYDAEGEVTLNEIADMGTFNKTGEATMTVTENFNALSANITAGTFIINNDSEMGGSGNTFEVTNEMRVENASLQGYGDITAGDLIIGTGATFAPGNSTTTFKVTGNLIFENDGEYDVEFGQFDMDSEGHYNDNTQVSGTTTIDPNAKITLNNLEGKYYVAETIDLINAGTLADGFEYDEANVTFNDNDARDLREGYETRISTRVYTEGNALKIELQRKQSEYSESSEFDRSHNEQEVANAIDAISTGNGGDITNPLDAMEQLYYYESTYDIDGLKAALNDIGGVIHSNATNLTFFNTKAEHVYDKVKERTQDILPCKKAHDKIWAEYYYNNYNVDKDDNSPKHETSVNGFLVGFDMISAKNLTLGITAGYGTSELKQTNDKATMNDINLGFYGGYENDKWLLKGMLLGGYEQYSIDRTIAFMDRTANSEHNGYSAALDLEAGYKISLNRKDSQAKHKIYLKPFIGAIGSYINNEGYEEKNAESLNLKVEDYNALTAEARAGLELNGKVKKFGWYAKAGVRQLLTDKQNEIETSLLDFADETKMKIWSAENAQTTLTGGIGANYDLSENWNIFANGIGNFADVSTNYYANVGLMYKFGCVNNKKVTDEDVEKISAMLNDKITQEEILKKDLEKKDKELKDAADREKELKDKVQKYESNVANIVTEEKATQMKQKTIKTFKLGEKPTFVFGTDQLNGNGKESLKQVAAELENYPNAEVLIEGHTDNVGSDEVNQRISENRAASVANTLKKDYKVKNPIAVIGKGKKDPIASNDTAEGRAKNRRVEIIITTAE